MNKSEILNKTVEHIDIKAFDRYFNSALCTYLSLAQLFSSRLKFTSRFQELLFGHKHFYK